MPNTPACEDKEVSINIMKLRRICPQWADSNFLAADCWCAASRQPDGKFMSCPIKPDDWKEGMPGRIE